MSTEQAASPNTDSKENTPLGQPQQLSRSPQPYHRRRSTLLHHDGDLSLQSPNTLTIPSTSPQKPSKLHTEATYFDADHRKRRKHSHPSSDSGTEADNERGSLLLGLPAPPVRLRKGLKGANNSETASPLLTPSYLDEEPRRLALKAQSSRQASLQNRVYTDEETAKLREKFTRRRRAELIRRTTETILIGFVGFIAFTYDFGWLKNLYAKEGFQSDNILEGIDLGHVSLALCSHAVVITSLYALYPLRIIFKNHTVSVSKKRSPFYIHIPAAFEPAPLLYPVLIPLFVALSMLRANVTVLLPNLVLSIAAIPSKIVPFNSNVPWYCSVQWLLSSGPVMTSWWEQSNDNPPVVSGGARNNERNNREDLLLLYPLHQTLLPVLGYLTTTSLLPAELQLLSVAMINLLLYAESPQTLILQSLLWIGGLLIFVWCGKFLKWEVALARIPSWRFRKPQLKVSKRNVLLSAIDDFLDGRLSRRKLISTNLSDSDDTESDDPYKFQIKPHKNPQQMLSVDNRRTEYTESGTYVQRPNSNTLVSSEKPRWFNGNVKNTEIDLDTKRLRRYTLPSATGASSVSPLPTTLKRSKTTQNHRPRSWSLRSFTQAQAVVAKWAFALYVYTVIFLIGAFVVRIYVGHYALQGQEPVGWALAYLFGNIPLFRYLTINWTLDQWIPLPRPTSSSVTQSYRIVDLYDHLGSANIRLLICLYCLGIIAVGLAVVFRLSAIAEVDTRRKVFHGMMVAMFLPTIFVDPTFVSLAFILILAIFLLLDLFRASQLPPLSRPLTHFLAPYVDGRDHRGPVIVSHVFLLIGCALPLWLSLAAIERSGEGSLNGWEVKKREMSMISGVVCVGMGDAAASLIGRRYGRRRWCWSGGKSLEGSLAFAVAVILGLSCARAWLLIGGWSVDNKDSWMTTMGKAWVAALGASLTEAVLTGGNDNVIVPIILWLLVRGLKI